MDLNGCTIVNQVDNQNTDVIVVSGGTTTIKGEGIVQAVSGNDGFTVIAEGNSTLNITGGHFITGHDAEGNGNSCIYARGNAKVYISGGIFESDGNISDSFSPDQYSLLNKKDADRETTVIEVTGGEFKNFNPACNSSEGPNTSFVKAGYKVINKATGEEVNTAHSGTTDIWYKVVK